VIRMAGRDVVWVGRSQGLFIIVRMAVPASVGINSKVCRATDRTECKSIFNSRDGDSSSQLGR
jgi:hypothetical protein